MMTERVEPRTTKGQAWHTKGPATQIRSIQTFDSKPGYWSDSSVSIQITRRVTYMHTGCQEGQEGTHSWAWQPPLEAQLERKSRLICPHSSGRDKLECKVSPFLSPLQPKRVSWIGGLFFLVATPAKEAQLERKSRLTCGHSSRRDKLG